MGIVTDLALYLFEANAEFHILLSRFFEAISSRGYHSWNKFIGSKPCGNTSPKESALLVVGAEEGIGRAMALKFAQQGYTVFACFPKYDAQAYQSEDGRTSTVSSLVYSWQKRSHKQNRPGYGRSPGSGEGSIIPLSFDYSKLEERHHALETVIAYCARHSLQLSSLVLSPHAEQHAITSVPLSLINGSVWSELIRREVIEPVLVVQDFLGLLEISEGKVVLLTGCSKAGSGVSQGPTIPCDAAREAIAKLLRQELSPRGVSVSLVIAAPLVGCRKGLRIPYFSSSKEPVKILRGTEASTHLPHDITLSSLTYAIDDETVFSVVSRAINGSYPKPTYYVGISVRIRRWAQLIPDPVWSLALLAWNILWPR